MQWERLLINQHNTELVLREEGRVPSVQWYLYYLKGTQLGGLHSLVT